MLPAEFDRFDDSRVEEVVVTAERGEPFVHGGVGKDGIKWSWGIHGKGRLTAERRENQLMGWNERRLDVWYGDGDDVKLSKFQLKSWERNENFSVAGLRDPHSSGLRNPHPLGLRRLEVVRYRIVE